MADTVDISSLDGAALFDAVNSGGQPAPDSSGAVGAPEGSDPYAGEGERSEPAEGKQPGSVATPQGATEGGTTSGYNAGLDGILAAQTTGAAQPAGRAAPGGSVSPEVKQLLANYQAQLAELRQQHETQRAELDTIRNVHREASVGALDIRIAETRQNIALARAEGDTEKELDLLEDLQKLRQRREAADQQPLTNQGARQAAKQDGTSTEEAARRQTEFKTWHVANRWYGTNQAATQVADELGRRVRANPATQHLRGAMFYEAVRRATMQYMQTTQTAPKVATNDTQGAGGGVSTAGLSGETLAYAKSQAQQYVGEGKAFKTEGDWLAYFASALKE